MLRHSLFVDVKVPVAVGVEENRLAVARPSSRPVQAVIQSKSLSGFQCRAVAGQLCKVNVALALIVEEGEALESAVTPGRRK